MAFFEKISKKWQATSFYQALAKRTNKLHFKNYVAYVVLAAFLVYALIAKNSLSRTNIIMFEKMGIAILLAVSLSFVVGFLGELSLGHAGFMCVGAYLGGKVAALLEPALGNGILLLVISILVGGCVAAIMGFVVGLPALRLKGDYLAIVTLAFCEIVHIVFLNLPDSLFGGAMGLKTPRYSNKVFFIIIFVVVLLSVAVFQNIIRSKHGRAITAIRDSEIAARATGINVTKYKLMAFVVSAFFAGVAGVLFSFTQTKLQSNYFDYNYSIDILVMVVLGGMGSFNGSIFAAAIITFVNTKLSTILTGNLAVLQKIIYALILVLIVIYGNAPGLRSFREKYNLKKLFNKLRKKRDPSIVNADEAQWSRIQSKIEMNEVLSTDLNVKQSTINPDGRGGAD